MSGSGSKQWRVEGVGDIPCPTAICIRRPPICNKNLRERKSIFAHADFCYRSAVGGCRLQLDMGYPQLPQPAIASIRFHSSSVTGITERREIRTSGNEANALSALTAANVT